MGSRVGIFYPSLSPCLISTIQYPVHGPLPRYLNSKAYGMSLAWQKHRDGSILTTMIIEAIYTPPSIHSLILGAIGGE